MRKDVKNEILEATISLINEKGSDPDKITIREICDRVGIGAGLVNYHFQTKENLIAQCVQKIIDGVIGMHVPMYQSLTLMNDIEKLRYMTKATCMYLATHENISRISILTDFTTTNRRDNTAGTAAAYYPLFRKALPATVPDEEVKRRTYLMILTLQAAFLRSSLLKDEIGISFQEKEQRDRLVDEVLDFYLKP